MKGRFGNQRLGLRRFRGAGPERRPVRQGRFERNERKIFRKPRINVRPTQRIRGNRPVETRRRPPMRPIRKRLGKKKLSQENLDNDLDNYFRRSNKGENCKFYF